MAKKRKVVKRTRKNKTSKAKRSASAKKAWRTRIRKYGKSGMK